MLEVFAEVVQAFKSDDGFTVCPDDAPAVWHLCEVSQLIMNSIIQGNAKTSEFCVEVCPFRISTASHLQSITTCNESLQTDKCTKVQTLGFSPNP